MIAHSSVARPTIDSSEPSGSSCGADGSRESGTRGSRATSASRDDRHVHEEHRSPPEVLRAARHPRWARCAMPMADTPAHTPIALARSRGSWNTLVRIESVAGMMNARADAHERARADEHLGRRRERRQRRPDAEDRRGRARGTGSARTGHRGCPTSAAGRRTRSRRRRRSTGAGSPSRRARRAPAASRAWGCATFRMVLSRPMISRLMHSTSSVSHRFFLTYAGSRRRSRITGSLGST